MITTETGCQTEAELLHFYLGMRLANGGRNVAVADLLAEFAEYRSQLDAFRATLREAEAQSARGESRPLDLEDIFRRGRERLDAKGITD